MSDIVERLRAVANDVWAHEINEGNEHLITAKCASVMREAAEEIEFLRKHAGAISRGPSFAEIAKDLARRSNEPPEAA